MHVSTVPPLSCGLLAGDGTLVKLIPASTSRPIVYAQSACGGYAIKVGATTEPTLQGSNDTLGNLIARIVGRR
jgi:hypothetical protein